jgi:hypothetical protein
MMTQLRWSPPRLLPIICTRQQERRVIAWAVAVLACIGGIAVGPEAVRVGTPALGQATSGLSSPPADTPVMAPGQRVKRPFGWIEIKTFDSTEGDPSVFKIEFQVVCESSPVNFDPMNEFRLIVDGVPRSPAESHPGSTYVRSESAEDGNVIFSVHGQHRVVHVQFGTGSSGRSFLRWPD